MIFSLIPLPLLSSVCHAAVELYTEAIGEAIHDRDALKLLLCNRAMTYLKLNQPLLCKNDCTAALEIDPSNVKAYYRRALGMLACFPNMSN